MAEWLRSGLQIRVRRFDSGSGLHISRKYARQAALAQVVEHIIRNDGVRGSSPLSGTTQSLKIRLAPGAGDKAAFSRDYSVTWAAGRLQ